MKTTANKMKVEIWSDIMCPFCYIGKRKFETALSQFNHASDVKIVWKSFLLSPDMKTAPDKNIHQFLAEHKDISIEQARNLNNQVALSAQQNGLVYNFDKTIPANSFNAHRLSHLAKQHGLQEDAEEITPVVDNSKEGQEPKNNDEAKLNEYNALFAKAATSIKR